MLRGEYLLLCDSGGTAYRGIQSYSVSKLTNHPLKQKETKKGLFIPFSLFPVLKNTNIKKLKSLCTRTGQIRDILETRIRNVKNYLFFLPPEPEKRKEPAAYSPHFLSGGPSFPLAPPTQNRIEQNRIEQNRIEQNRIEQNRTEQNRIE